MKKLTLSKPKIATCFLLLCLLLGMNSCKKDHLNRLSGNPNVKQLIKEETLVQWFEKSEAAKLITLDWRSAKQTIIDGKNVVRVPTFFVDRISNNILNKTVKNAKSTFGTNEVPKTSSNTLLSNYDYEHPPELFFIEDPKKKQLSTFLLNFIPATEQEKKDKSWTGKLYEWNLTGDTVFIQELVKSRLKEQYVIKLKPQDGNSENGNKSTAAIKGSEQTTNGFWGDLWDKLGELVGWIGSIFGLSEHVWDWYDGEMEWRLHVDIDWSTGGSPTGADASGFGNYTAAGAPIYGSYVPGLAIGSGSQVPIYVGYPGNVGPIYTPSEQIALYLSSRLTLSAEEYAFLVDHPSIASSLKNFLDENGLIEGNEAYTKWAVRFFMENPGLSFNDLVEYIDEDYADSDNIIVVVPSTFIEIPERIILNNGQIVNIVFGISDNKVSAKQKVHPKLVEALKSALDIAATHTQFNSIFISATTNGVHAPDSKHYKGIGLDISRINGVQMLVSGNNTQVSSLQNAFESLSNIRENFGPSFIHKNKLPTSVSGHKDHIHITINL